MNAVHSLRRNFWMLFACAAMFSVAVFPLLSRAQTAVPVCGDGIIQFGEECDAGSRNGDSDGFCSEQCTYNALMCFYAGCGCYENGQNASFSIGQQPPGLWRNGLQGPRDIALDPKYHFLYIADRTNNRIIMHRLTAGNELRNVNADGVIGQNSYTTNGTSELDRPTSVALDSDNNVLFISDQKGGGRVIAYTNVVNGLLSTSQKVIINGNGSIVNEMPIVPLSNPHGIAYSKRGYLYVADTGKNRVLRYDLTKGADNVKEKDILVLGQSTLTSTGPGSGLNKMNAPMDVAYDPVREELFVADTNNHRILLFKESEITGNGVEAERQFGLGYNGTTDELMRAPQGVAVHDTTILVSDTNNNRVLFFDRDLAPNDHKAHIVFGQNTMFSSQSLPFGFSGSFLRPTGLTTIPDTCQILIADTDKNRIAVMDDKATCGQSSSSSSSAEPTILGISTTMPDKILVLFSVPLEDDPALNPAKYEIRNQEIPEPTFVPVASAEKLTESIILLRTQTSASSYSFSSSSSSAEEELREETSYLLKAKDMLPTGVGALAFTGTSVFTTGKNAQCSFLLPSGECCDPSSCAAAGTGATCLCCGCGVGLQCGDAGICSEIPEPPEVPDDTGGDDEGLPPGSGLTSGETAGDPGSSASSGSSDSSSSDSSSSEPVTVCGTIPGGAGLTAEMCTDGNASCEFGQSCQLQDGGTPGATCSCASSCPFVYSWNGEEFIIESEAIPFSFLHTLEDTSYGGLRSLVPHDEKLTISVREERDETSYIDAFSLLQVEHDDPSANVYPDVNGNLHTLRTPVVADWCESSEWEDCTSSLTANDEDIFEIDPLTVYERSPDDLTHWVTLGFTKPKNAGSTAKLLVNVETTEEMDIVAYRNVSALGGRGQKAMDLILRLPFLRNLFDTNFDLGKLYLHVEVWDGKNWTKQGIVKPGNYRHWDDFVIPLDIRNVPGDEVRVRLTSVGWYLYNFAGIDWSENVPLTVRKLPASSVLKNGEVRAESLLHETDGDRLILKKGEEVTIDFPALPATKSVTEYVFGLTGYYLVDVPAGQTSWKDMLKFFSYMIDMKGGMNRGFGEYIEGLQ